MVPASTAATTIIFLPDFSIAKGLGLRTAGAVLPFEFAGAPLTGIQGNMTWTLARTLRHSDQGTEPVGVLDVPGLACKAFDFPEEPNAVLRRGAGGGRNGSPENRLSNS